MSESVSPPASRPAPTRRARLYAVWNRHARVYADSFWANATPAVFEPLFMLLAIGIGLGRYIDEQFAGVTYAEFMAPGILAMTAVYTASFEATYATFVRLTYQRTYQSMLATPLTLADLFQGELLWCASKGFLFSTIVGLVLAAFGLVSSWWGLAIPFLGFVIAGGFGGLGFFVTSLVKNMNHFQFYFTAGLTPLVFFSGLMFPVGDLPPGLRETAYALPMFHCIECFRLVMTGQGSVDWAWVCPLVVAAYCGLLAWLGVRAMVRRLRA